MRVLEFHRTLYKEQPVAPDIMTMPDEGVPSYRIGHHTLMIPHDHGQKVAIDPKLSKSAGKVKNAQMNFLSGADAPGGYGRGSASPPDVVSTRIMFRMPTSE